MVAFPPLKKLLNLIPNMKPRLITAFLEKRKYSSPPAPKKPLFSKWYTSGFGIISGLLSNKKLRSEQPKAPFTRSLWPRLLQALIHIIAIGITASLVAISLVHIYWSDPGEPYITTKPQAFQFGAKVYDIFVCWSCATMVLYVLRANLSGGVTFGSLVTGYDLATARTFLSPSFWAGFSRDATRSSLVLTVTLTLAALLAAISAPLTAILLIPKLQWFEAQDIQALSSPCWDCKKQPYQINANESVLWPSHLSSSHLPSTSCLLEPDRQDESCPGYGFRALLNAVWRQSKRVHLSSDL